MSRNFSPISRFVSIAFHVAVLVAMLQLSYGWSMEQTEIFMRAVIPGSEAKYGAWIVQFAPQVLLVIAAIFMAQGNRRMAYLFAAGALIINGLDMYTNLVTFQELWPGLSEYLEQMGRSTEFIQATKPVGQILAGGVTWFEELAALVAGSMLQVTSELAKDMGWNVPKFFRAQASNYLRAAAGDIGALSEPEQPAPQPQRVRPAGRPVRR